jgi:hypothetical protein
VGSSHFTRPSTATTTLLILVITSLGARPTQPVSPAHAPSTIDSGPDPAPALEPDPILEPDPAPALDPGAYHSPAIRIDGTPRLYPLTRNVWVRPHPSHADPWIGFLWFGSSVRLRDEPSMVGPGCGGRYHAIEPRGYVCVDGERATLNAADPTLIGVTRYAPNLASAWPHRYGESLGLRRYFSLPSEAPGADDETVLLPTLPKTLQMDRSEIGRRSTLAWSRERVHHGRSFLLSSDLTWMPKDRVKAYPTVTFHGVRLGSEARLPLAFFRERDRPSFELGADGSFQRRQQMFPRLSWVELSGRSAGSGAQRLLETREPGVYVRASDAVVPELARETPWLTRLDAADPAARAPRGRGTWLDVSILGGWLIAYEGHTPVYATLISAGRGGAPVAGRNPVETASTPTGRFKITGKFATATMVAPNDVVHSEVPWAQNFSGPHALHAAYWHDDWGELASGGCINLSPLDARWLSEFTEPRLPDGWHGVRWLPELEPATTLIVRR